VIYDVDIVAVPEQAVLVLRDRGSLNDVGRRVARLRDLAAQAGLTPAGPPMARFYEDEFTAPTLDYDVCLPVEPRADGSVPDTIAEARGELIPLHHVLQAAHTGGRDGIGDAWRAVNEAREALGYARAGPTTEVYAGGSAASASSVDPVTLIRQPYAR